MRKTQIDFEPIDDMQRQPPGIRQHQQPSQPFNNTVAVRRRAVNGRFLSVESQHVGGELHMERKGGRRLELVENGGVFLEELLGGGGSGEVEVGLQRRDRG